MIKIPWQLRDLLLCLMSLSKRLLFCFIIIIIIIILIFITVVYILLKNRSWRRSGPILFIQTHKIYI